MVSLFSLATRGKRRFWQYLSSAFLVDEGVIINARAGDNIVEVVVFKGMDTKRYLFAFEGDRYKGVKEA